MAADKNRVLIISGVALFALGVGGFFWNSATSNRTLSQPTSLSSASEDDTQLIVAKRPDDRRMQAGSAATLPGEPPNRAPASLPSHLGGENSAQRPRFPDGAGKIILSEERPLLSKGQQEIGRIRTRVVKTQFMYPLIRVVEKFERQEGSGPLTRKSRVVAVADHVVVRLKVEQTEGSLEKFVEQNGFKIRKSLEIPRAYLVSFEANQSDSLEKAVVKLKNSGLLEFAEADTIVSAL